MQDVMPSLLSEAERDWRIQCRDEEDPPKGPTCRECRFSCQAYEDGKGASGPWLCLFEAVELRLVSACVIDPDGEACESIEIV